MWLGDESMKGQKRVKFIQVQGFAQWEYLGANFYLAIWLNVFCFQKSQGTWSQIE